MAKRVRSRVKIPPGAVHVTAGGGVQLDARLLMRIVAEQAEGSALELTRKFIRALNDGREVRKLLYDEHEDLANRTQNAVYQSYMQTHKGLESYRKNDTGHMARYGGGTLGRLLQSEHLARATYRGIHFMNVREFNKQARQWRRLNFGAGLERHRPQMPSITIKGVNTGMSADYNHIGARPAMFMPQGMWLGRAFSNTRHAYGFKYKAPHYAPGYGGGKYFYPTPKRGKAASFLTTQESTVGYLKGRGFLDEGLLFLNAEYGRAIGRVMNKWSKDSKSEAIRSMSGASLR